MARPKKTIDKDRVELLASIACTVEEIAADQNVSKRTIERRFVAALERGRELAKLSVRAQQFQLMKGRPAQAAVYLRENQDANGNQFGPLVRDKDGGLILIRKEVPESKPVPSLAIFLGKNLLGQSDKVAMEFGDGFEFVSGGK